jgi:hypothetical protein
MWVSDRVSSDADYTISVYYIVFFVFAFVQSPNKANNHLN